MTRKAFAFLTSDRLRGPRPVAHQAIIGIGPVVDLPRGQIMEMKLKQKGILTVAFTDKNGAVAPVDGPAQWQIDNPSVASLAPSPDGLTCEVLSLAPGSAKVTVSGDGDLTTGVRLVSDVATVNVTSNEAVAAKITEGPVTDV
jgi:hypothetical protein